MERFRQQYSSLVTGAINSSATLQQQQQRQGSSVHDQSASLVSKSSHDATTVQQYGNSLLTLASACNYPAIAAGTELDYVVEAPDAAGGPPSRGHTPPLPQGYNSTHRQAIGINETVDSYSAAVNTRLDLLSAQEHEGGENAPAAGQKFENFAHYTSPPLSQQGPYGPPFLINGVTWQPQALYTNQAHQARGDDPETTRPMAYGSGGAVAPPELKRRIENMSLGQGQDTRMDFQNREDSSGGNGTIPADNGGRQVPAEQLQYGGISSYSEHGGRRHQDEEPPLPRRLGQQPPRCRNIKEYDYSTDNRSRGGVDEEDSSSERSDFNDEGSSGGLPTRDPACRPVRQLAGQHTHPSQQMLTPRNTHPRVTPPPPVRSPSPAVFIGPVQAISGAGVALPGFSYHPPPSNPYQYGMPPPPGTILAPGGLAPGTAPYYHGHHHPSMPSTANYHQDPRAYGTVPSFYHGGAYYDSMGTVAALPQPHMYNPAYLAAVAPLGTHIREDGQGGGPPPHASTGRLTLSNDAEESKYEEGDDSVVEVGMAAVTAPETYDHPELLTSAAMAQPYHSSKSDHSPGKTVAFARVEIRYYERILGDNPSCTAGPPMSIGWRYDPSQTVVFGVDEYEMARGEVLFSPLGLYRNEVGGKHHPSHFHRNISHNVFVAGIVPRIDGPDLVLTRAERQDMLISLGYSSYEIAVSVRHNVKTKNQRRQTVNNLPVMKFEETIERAKRKVRRIFRRKDKTSSLYEEWEKAAAPVPS